MSRTVKSVAYAHTVDIDPSVEKSGAVWEGIANICVTAAEKALETPPRGYTPMQRNSLTDIFASMKVTHRSIRLLVELGDEKPESVDASRAPQSPGWRTARRTRCAGGRATPGARAPGRRRALARQPRMQLRSRRSRPPARWVWGCCCWARHDAPCEHVAGGGGGAETILGGADRHDRAPRYRLSADRGGHRGGGLGRPVCPPGAARVSPTQRGFSLQTSTGEGPAEDHSPMDLTLGG